MTPRLRRIGINTILVAVSLVVTALLFEGGLRVYAGVLFPKMMVLNDTLGWQHSANVSRVFRNETGQDVLVVANASGYRGPARARERTPGKYRILALGDSFTEGVQVEEQDLFTAQLEHLDSSLEVINAGVGGYGTVQEYLYLTSEGAEFNPDSVLLMFFENDLTDNALSYYPGFGPRPYAKREGGVVRIIETLDDSGYRRFVLPAPFPILLNKYSYVYYFANSRIYQPMFAERLRELQQADFRRIDTETRYAIFFGVLSKIREFLEARSIPLLVVVIPTRDEVMNGHSDVARIVLNYCENQGIPCHSLLETFVEHSSAETPPYFREDIHWTKHGHLLAARAIAKVVHSSGRVGQR